MKNVLKVAGKVLDNEAKAIKKLKSSLSNEFVKCVECVFNCKGKIIISGMGKSGNVARKIAATLTSTGTTAIFLNPAEAIHGDIGVLSEDDVFIALSKSGNTAEINSIIPFIKRYGIPLISITNEPDNALSKNSNISLHIHVENEACPMNLAPTTSTTAMMALGDALAVSLMEMRGFTSKDFKEYHPGGMIGKQLLHVESLMETENLPIVSENVSVREAIEVIVKKKNRGIVIAVDNRGKLCGVLVDGDLKRLALKYNGDFLNKKLKQVMSVNPKTIPPDHFIGEALKIMENKYTSLVVIRDKKPIGLLHIHDILEARVI